MRRSVVALIAILAATAVGCGKSDVAFVKPTIIPLYACTNQAGAREAGCAGHYDVGRLIGMSLPEAEGEARKHGFVLRKLGPPLGLALEGDYRSNRLDIECSSPGEECIVVRIVRKG